MILDCQISVAHVDAYTELLSHPLIFSFMI